jgi:hypothetical protein
MNTAKRKAREASGAIITPNGSKFLLIKVE